VSVVSKPVDRLITELRGAGMKFRTDEPLSRYTTIGLGGPAQVMAFPSSAAELETIVGMAGELAVPLRVLGGGSNLIVAEDGVRGVVVHTGAMKITRIENDGRLEAEAGVHFPGLVRAAVARGLRGLEGGVGIPGSLGGVLAMNAGAYGFSIGDFVELVTVVAPGRGRIDLGRDQVDFLYRSTSFADDVIVAGCRLRLDQDEPEAVRKDMNRRLDERKTSQPVGVKSAGCIFKNPPGDSAGRIIDGLGLKGLRIGGAWVSEAHANFIVHGGDARVADVVALVDEIRDRVCRATSIELEEEVKRWM
jgi:UDP-N-acetylmuramate dehydrogenase